MKIHHYTLQLEWTGNKGKGTSGYAAYKRDHVIRIDGKPELPGSSDPAFRGDSTRYNPEELLLASVASCHMLWYLHLCAEAGVIVVNYEDNPAGEMTETTNGGGRFTGIILRPDIVVAEDAMIDKANALHKRANELCFIANSLNFPVRHEASCRSVGE